MTELELQLVALGRELDVPEPPDLATAVMARISPRRIRPRRRLVLAVALALLAAVGATLAIPSARSAFLRILHIGGEQIEIVEQPPPLRPRTKLDLGERVTLDEARRRMTFRVLVPKSEPDAVYYDARTVGGEITLLYGTPQHVRLLVTERRGRFDQRFVKKIITPGTRLDFVDVNGAQGLFISGKPHFYYLVDERGQIVEETLRLATNTLVWDRGGVAYRIEGRLTVDQALTLAGSLR